MRKKWLGLATLLVSGGAAEAQQNSAAQGGYAFGFRPIPVVAPYNPYGYPGMMPVPHPMGYPPMGAVPMYPGAMPGQMPGQPMPGMPMPGMPPQPFVPVSMGSPPMPPPGAPPGAQPAPMPMGPQAPMNPALPPSPTVPMTMVDPGSFARPPVAFHRPRCDKWWFKGDFLLAWISNGPLQAPLVTSGAATDPQPGALDPADTGTAVLFGGNGLNYGILGGFRLEGGAFLDRGNCYSVDVGTFVLSPTNIQYTAGSDAAGSPLIARPIINAATGAERSFLTSSPGSLAGSTTVESRSDIWSVEFNGRRHGYWGERLHAEGLFGFRTINLRENIRIQDNLRDLSGNFLTFNGTPLGAGDRLFEEDLFRASNQFYGFQLGGGLTFEKDWFSFGVMSKVGLGVTDQETIINGFASLNSATLGNATSTGGILAQLTNIGERHNYVFGLVPEIGANLGVNISKHVRLSTGYTFLYWNNVIRPGDLIDRAVNPGFPPGSPAFGASGPARPAYVSSETSFVVHTFNFGLEFRF
jgi:hypothetical protein